MFPSEVYTLRSRSQGGLGAWKGVFLSQFSWDPLGKQIRKFTTTPKKPCVSVSLSYGGYGLTAFRELQVASLPGAPSWAETRSTRRPVGVASGVASLATSGFNPFLPALPLLQVNSRAMKSFSPILLLLVFLFAWLGSKAAPWASPPEGSDFSRIDHPSQPSPPASENSTLNGPNPESPRTAYPEPCKTPHAVSPEPSPLEFTETPNTDLRESPHPESPEAPKPNSLNTSVSESLDILQIKPSKMTYPEPSETPKPDPTEIPHTEFPETPKPNSFKISHPTFPETPNTDPTHTPHQEFPEIPKCNSTEISPTESHETPQT